MGKEGKIGEMEKLKEDFLKSSSIHGISQMTRYLHNEIMLTMKMFFARTRSSVNFFSWFALTIAGFLLTCVTTYLCYDVLDKYSLLNVRVSLHKMFRIGQIHRPPLQWLRFQLSQLCILQSPCVLLMLMRSPHCRICLGNAALLGTTKTQVKSALEFRLAYISIYLTTDFLYPSPLFYFLQEIFNEYGPCLTFNNLDVSSNLSNYPAKVQGVGLENSLRIKLNKHINEKKITYRVFISEVGTTVSKVLTKCRFFILKYES